MEIRITKRLSFDALFASLFGIFMLFMPAVSDAQKSTGKLKAPSHPTKIEVKDRTISDLLYFPLSCIEALRNKKTLIYLELSNKVRIFAASECRQMARTVCSCSNIQAGPF